MVPTWPPLAFVPLFRTTTYNCCTHCIVGLIYDVEAAACVKLFEKRLFVWTERLTYMTLKNVPLECSWLYIMITQQNGVIGEANFTFPQMLYVSECHQR